MSAIENDFPEELSRAIDLFRPPASILETTSALLSITLLDGPSLFVGRLAIVRPSYPLFLRHRT